MKDQPAHEFVKDILRCDPEGNLAGITDLDLFKTKIRGSWSYRNLRKAIRLGREGSAYEHADALKGLLFDNLQQQPQNSSFGNDCISLLYPFHAALLLGNHYSGLVQVLVVLWFLDKRGVEKWFGDKPIIFTYNDEESRWVIFNLKEATVGNDSIGSNSSGSNNTVKVARKEQKKKLLQRLKMLTSVLTPILDLWKGWVQCWIGYWWGPWWALVCLDYNTELRFLKTAMGETRGRIIFGIVMPIWFAWQLFQFLVLFLGPLVGLWYLCSTMYGFVSTMYHFVLPFLTNLPDPLGIFEVSRSRADSSFRPTFSPTPPPHFINEELVKAEGQLAEAKAEAAEAKTAAHTLGVNADKAKQRVQEANRDANERVQKAAAARENARAKAKVEKEAKVKAAEAEAKATAEAAAQAKAKADKAKAAADEAPNAAEQTEGSDTGAKAGKEKGSDAGAKAGKEKGSDTGPEGSNDSNESYGRLPDWAAVPLSIAREFALECKNSWGTSSYFCAAVPAGGLVVGYLLMSLP